MNDLILIENDTLYVKKGMVTFNYACSKLLGNLYTPGLLYHSQASGYMILRQLVIDRADLDTLMKHRASFHPHLFSVLIKFWEVIRYLEVEPENESHGFFVSHI